MTLRRVTVKAGRFRKANFDAVQRAHHPLSDHPRLFNECDNGVVTDPVEAWCYFLRRADEMTAAEIRQRFSSRAFNEAAEVLEMIQRTPGQRSQYELRLKAQRDERARMQYAVDQARQEGEAGAEARGRIELLRELLGFDQTSIADLSTAQLAALEGDLKRQLRERGV
ncbi:PD-(D/E)XK nuclease family transposase [Stieleria neptunia]|uniref:PD-(D/E)XK nuclease family transposase n=1 Tax=Stieleria neptunia TaxID=2527979 RepID=A0A518HW74_9BACT|nr:Rpn family recombination-promoting nuclease/putative transposase [Stieleria neptunia]QDV45073.1 PD-(D/E)XK nuclease family transposase [Stieleria neptunia]